jgi:type II secretory ATPase GspE/PulE/Tfp pilus assembly ATPase PilB-like protein
MKAEPFLLASSMTCVVAQRVLRKICDNCIEKYAPPEEALTEMKKVLGPIYDAYVAQQEGKQIMLSRGRKCEKCGDTGFRGRLAIFEVLKVTEKIGKLILERAPAIQIEQAAVLDGMVLMEQDGYLKVLDGLTTLEEVMRVAKT